MKMNSNYSLPGYAPVATLRGEIGTSTVREREIKSKLKFAKYLMNAENELVREVFGRMIEEEKSKKWIMIIDEYKGILGITYGQLRCMSDKEIGEKVQQYGLEEWRREVE